MLCAVCYMQMYCGDFFQITSETRGLNFMHIQPQLPQMDFWPFMENMCGFCMEYLISPVWQKEFYSPIILLFSCQFTCSLNTIRKGHTSLASFYSTRLLRVKSHEALFIDWRVILSTCFTLAPGYYLKMRLL